MKWPNSLYGRVFATFWLSLLVVVMVLLAIPQLDPRSEHRIPKAHLEQMQRATERLSRRHQSLEEKMASVKEKQREHGFRAYFTTPDGQSLEPQTKSSRILANFSSLSYDPQAPQQKLYGNWMISGPFEIQASPAEHQVDSAYMYILRRWQRPPPWFLQILDKPLQLLLITMVISTPFLLWLSWAISQPARRLERAADNVRRGQFSPDRSLERGPKEFVRTGRSFNHMVQSVNQMISGQQRLLSDISHELRSPLTRLRMATALAVRKQGDSKELQRIDTEADRMEKMIGDLLKLSRMQVDSHQDHAHTDAVALWQEMLDDAHFEAEQQNKQCHYNRLEAWPLHGHPALLCSALENVVRNAIKYANNKIDIQFGHHNGQLTIIVEDDGDGVPDGEHSEIFRPFYRVSTARDRDSGGTGLGLSITDTAIRQHHGDIHASPSDSGGLRVTIRLPLDQA